MLVGSEISIIEPGFQNYTFSLEDLFRNGDARAAEKQEEAANIRLIQQTVMAIGQADLAGVGELLTDDVRLEIRGCEQFPFVRDARGRAAVLAAIKHNFAEVQDQQPRLESVVAQGDTVIVMASEQGVIKSTGAAYHIEGIQRFVCRNGKISLVHEILIEASSS